MITEYRKIAWEFSDLWFPHVSYPFKARMRPQTARSLIKITCPKGGWVLDPMAGSGTTCLVAQLINLERWDLLHYEPNEIARMTRWGLKWVGIEINPKYVEIAERRLKPFMVKKLSCLRARRVGMKDGDG